MSFQSDFNSFFYVKLGPLSLKKLKSVSSYDIDVLRAVSKLCTSIQKVEFLGYPKSLSLLSASQLEEIWKNWSNVRIFFAIFGFQQLE